MFPGTLNVVLNTPYKIRRANSFDEERKSFVISAKINGIDCLLYAARSFPFHVYEIISSVQLRKKLQLQDGDIVEIETEKKSIAPISGWRKTLWDFLYKGREDVYYHSANFDILMKNRIFKKLHRLIENRKIKEKL